ncbi:uncharacterized protein LOC130641923 isoform X2 [Hydractinia symbiolongicarpus]|nr:uncharacterized protein LOC130641923 isoform X2 [Hydractinia symbiolongicarpus]XP_057304929.1 uncharacterized protein LOC130641923 isoform X2 [Hydractinia symbiolongicarpus]
MLPTVKVKDINSPQRNASPKKNKEASSARRHCFAPYSPFKSYTQPLKQLHNTPVTDVTDLTVLTSGNSCDSTVVSCNGESGEVLCSVESKENVLTDEVHFEVERTPCKKKSYFTCRMSISTKTVINNQADSDDDIKVIEPPNSEIINKRIENAEKSDTDISTNDVEEVSTVCYSSSSHDVCVDVGVEQPAAIANKIKNIKSELVDTCDFVSGVTNNSLSNDNPTDLTEVSTEKRDIKFLLDQPDIDQRHEPDLGKTTEIEISQSCAKTFADRDLPFISTEQIPSQQNECCDESKKCNILKQTSFSVSNAVEGNSNATERNLNTVETNSNATENKSRETGRKKHHEIKKTFFTRRRCNIEEKSVLIMERYNVPPVSVVVVDIQLLGNFKHQKLLQKANAKFLHDKSKSLQDVKSIRDLKLSNYKPNNRIVNVTTDASADSVRETFEQKVARKLAEKRRLLGEPALILNTEKPVTSPKGTESDKKIKVISHSENEIQTLTKPRNVAIEPVVQKQNEVVTEKSHPILFTTNRQFQNPNTPMIYVEEPLNEALQLSNHKVKMIVQTRPRLPDKMGSAKRKKLSPQKSLSPNKKTKMSLKFNELTDPIIQKAGVELDECEAIRTVPLHPRIRMKLQSHCNCVGENCSHLGRANLSPVNSEFVSKSPNDTSPTAPKSFTDPVTKPSLFMSTPLTTSDALTTSDVSTSNCACNIISCPHVINPSPGRRSAVVFKSLTPKHKVKTPTKFRPTLLQRFSPKSPRSALSRIISDVHDDLKPEIEKVKTKLMDCVDVVSDAMSESQSSSCEEIIYPNIVHISSDDGPILEEDDIKKEDKLFIPSPIKTESIETDSTVIDFLIGDDENNDFYSSSDFVRRRRRKTSSKKRVESFIVKPMVAAPTLENSANTTPTNAVHNNKRSRPLKTVSKRQMIKLTKHFNLREFEVRAEKLSEVTVSRLIDLCTTLETWNKKELLLAAGLTEYDIKRLGLATMRRDEKNAKYGFRKFLKRRDVFQLVSEKPKNSKKKHQLDFLKSENRKLKEMALIKEREERKMRDLESIRRSLLKINAKFLNQSKFWNYINQGTVAKPIEI